MKIGQIKTSFGTADIELTRYRNNKTLAVYMTCYEEGIPEPFGTLSVNMVDHAHLLGRGEFFVKTWSENELLTGPAMETGLFVDTGRWADNGHVVAPVWRLNLPEETLVKIDAMER